MQSNDNQEIDFSMLREAKFVDVKVGDVLLTSLSSGDVKVKYKNCDITLLEFDDDSADTWAVEEFNEYPFYFKPLCWIEGKPVYKGDILWKTSGDYAQVEIVSKFQIVLIEYNSLNRLSWTKPKKTRMIGDIECPMPETKELQYDDEYYSLGSPRAPVAFCVNEYIWEQNSCDLELLHKGLVFLNREDAEKTAEAIFKLTRI